MPQPLEISEACVHHALMVFRSSTAPVPCGLCANHFKEAVSCPSPVSGSFVLSTLSCLVNYLVAGCTHSFIIPHICGATLLAIWMKNRGMQPITVGEVLRRLMSKSLSRATQHVVFSFLFPLQLGVGVRFGCEPIVHAVSHLMDSFISPDERWAL